MKFGIKTGQGLSGYTYDELSSIWSKSEELGFESAWLHDHFVSSTNRLSDPCLEAYTTLAALARDTRNLRLGVMVTCVGYRNPLTSPKSARQSIRFPMAGLSWGSGQDGLRKSSDHMDTSSLRSRKDWDN